MNEHPLLFTGEMVKAILDDRKTHTRRVPVELYRNWKVGDTIWVREAWRCTGGGDLRNIIYRAEGDSAQSFCGVDDGRVGILHVPEPHWAEWDRLVYETNRGCDWRSPIHMFRWAARIFLEITNIRVERVQDISVEDILAEGIEGAGWDYTESSDGTGDMFMYWTDPTKDMPKWCPQNTTSCECIEDVFSWLWDSINAKRHNGIYTWSENPVVKVIEFKKGESKCPQK